MEDTDVGGLAQARRVLLRVMRTKGAKMLFNEAVDPEAMGLPDYLEVITHPIDLGTILESLERGLNSSSHQRKNEKLPDADVAKRSIRGRDRSSTGDGSRGVEETRRSDGYSNPAQVFEDVCRVWDNCYQYNWRDCDAPTRGVCDEVKKSFERAWREHGLKLTARDPGKQSIRMAHSENASQCGDPAGMPQNGRGGSTASLGFECKPPAFRDGKYAVNCLDEWSVPDKFSMRADWSDLPLRMLDNFSLLHKDHFVSLDKLSFAGCTGMAAKGNLVTGSCLTGGSVHGGSGYHPVQLNDLLDWSIQYGDSPGMWIITKHAWYKLLNPSKEYEGFLSPTLGKFDFCIKASQMQHNHVQQISLEEDMDSIVDSILSNNPLLPLNGIENKEELMSFARRQLCSWLKITRQASDSKSAKTPKLPTGRFTGGANMSFRTQGLRSSSRKRPRAAALDRVESDKPWLSPNGAIKSSPSNQIHMGIGTAANAAEDERNSRDGANCGLKPEEVGDTFSMYTRASVRPKYPTEKILHGAHMKPGGAHDTDETLPVKNLALGRHQNVEGLKRDQVDHALQLESTRFPLLGSPASEHPDGQCGLDAEAIAIDSDGSGSSYPYESVVNQNYQTDALTARRRASAPSLVDISETSESEDALINKKRRKLSDFERKRLRRAKEDRARLRKDLRIDEDRAAPPLPKSSFRVEGPLVGEILSIWEFVAAFSGILQVPPFPYWRLEAAICPLRMMHKKSVQGPVVDLDGLASGILLRDIHIGLLRLVEGKGSNAEPPATAKLVDEDRGSAGLWFQRISLFLLRAPLDEVDEEARIIGQFLQTHDYVELDPHGRVKILKILMDLSLGTDLIRDSINGYVEGGTTQKKKIDGHDDPKQLESMEITDLGGNSGGDSVGKWMEWAHSCKLGFMKILGEDIRGRKYWVLGGHAGAWKIFVETPPEYTLENEPDEEHPHKGPQSQWGWYDANQLQDLVAWLEDGGLAYEKPLVALLEKIPDPPKIGMSKHGHQQARDTHSFNNPLTSITDQWPNAVHGASLHDDLESFRSDGYRSIVAPHFRGEGECAELSYASPIEVRILVCIQSILGLAPFWVDGQLQLGNSICGVIQGFQEARTVHGLSQQLLQAEEILSNHNCLRDTWGTFWQMRWRSSVHTTQSTEEIAMHLVTLQDFLKGDCFRLHRTAFNACASEARCPLYFPLPVESVVFLRTGCLLHLQKYLGSSDCNNLGHSGCVDDREFDDKADSGKCEAPCLNKNLHSAKEKVLKLKPVERFKICCISYRSPFACEYPKSCPSSQMTTSEPPQMQCLWLLIQPIAPVTGTVLDAIAVPIHIDNTLADFVVKIGTYDQGTKKSWKAGERFRMFFGGKSSRGGQGGVYYKGAVVNVEDVKPGIEYDPWESLTVEWDNDNSESSLMKVSPWEIEVDPEEEQRLEEERRREEEARSRAARAAAKQQRTEYIASLGAYEGASSSPNDPDFDPEMDIPGLGRNRRRGTALNEMVYYDPSNPVGPVPPGVIQALPEQEGFTILIYNFMKRLKGKFKCPIFAGHELDLHRVFHEVQNRGGYDRVTQLKLWKEVCRTLNVNLTGQTSASYNMRLNYEKCLLDFEHYLVKGEYTREVAEGKEPSSTRLDNAPVVPKARSPLQAPPSPSGFHPAETMNHAPQQQLLAPPMNQHLPNQSQAHGRDSLAQTAPAGFSMTELLLGDEIGQDYGHSSQSPAWDSMEAINSSAMNSSWLRMLAPTSTSNSNAASRPTTINPQIPQGWVGSMQASHLDDPTPLVEPSSNEEAYAAALGPSKSPMVEIQPGESIGMALNRMGRALVGADIWRRWPKCDPDGWLKASIADFRHSTNEHCLVYNQGTDTIKTEWVDLRELESEELSQFDPEAQSGFAPGEAKYALGIQPPSIHCLHTSQGSFHSLGTPPPIQQFGAAKVSQDTSGHSLVLGRGDRQSGASTRQLISQMIHMGVNPDHVKLIDSNQTSLLAHVSETLGEHVEGINTSGQSSSSRRMDLAKLQKNSSHNHFAPRADLSDSSTLQGCDAGQNCVSVPLMGQLQRNSMMHDTLNPELQVSLAQSQDLAYPKPLATFEEKSQSTVLSRTEQHLADNWLNDHGLGFSRDTPNQNTYPKSRGSEHETAGYTGLLASKEHALSKPNAQEEGHPTKESIMDEASCGIPRKSDMFKIKISMPQYKQ